MFWTDWRVSNSSYQLPADPSHASSCFRPNFAVRLSYSEHTGVAGVTRIQVETTIWRGLFSGEIREDWGEHLLTSNHLDHNFGSPSGIMVDQLKQFEMDHGSSTHFGLQKPDSSGTPLRRYTPNITNGTQEIEGQKGQNPAAGRMNLRSEPFSVLLLPPVGQELVAMELDNWLVACPAPGAPEAPDAGSSLQCAAGRSGPNSWASPSPGRDCWEVGDSKKMGGGPTFGIPLYRL